MIQANHGNFIDGLMHYFSIFEIDFIKLWSLYLYCHLCSQLKCLFCCNTTVGWDHHRWKKYISDFLFMPFKFHQKLKFLYWWKEKTFSILYLNKNYAYTSTKKWNSLSNSLISFISLSLFYFIYSQSLTLYFPPIPSHIFPFPT